MNENRVEGAFQNVAGKVQDAVGGLTGDASTQVEGKLRQAAGQVQDAYGEATDQVQRAATAVGKGVEQQPLVALLTAGVIGYVLGWLTFRR